MFPKRIKTSQFRIIKAALYKISNSDSVVTTYSYSCSYLIFENFEPYRKQAIACVPHDKACNTDCRPVF